MSKRFCETEIWNKAWYQDLTIKEKILVKYIYEKCDCAGVWEVNFKMASFLIGEKVDKSDIEKINAQNDIFEFIESDKIFVKKFIEFQYGKLSESCKPHKPVIEKLKKYNLYERVLKGYQKGIERVSENLQKGIDTLEEKEKEKEKEKDKEKEKEKEENKENEILIENLKNPDLMFDKNIEKVFTEYETKCKNCLPLKFERRNLELRQAIYDFLQYIKFDFGYIAELFTKADNLKKIYENPIDLKALIKNHERIYSGFYENNGNNNETVKAPKKKEFNFDEFFGRKVEVV